MGGEGGDTEVEGIAVVEIRKHQESYCFYCFCGAFV